MKIRAEAMSTTYSSITKAARSGLLPNSSTTLANNLRPSEKLEYLISYMFVSTYERTQMSIKANFWFDPILPRKVMPLSTHITINVWCIHTE